MIDFNSACLPGCAPIQVINFKVAINDMSNIAIYNDCDCEYDLSELQYGYSVDNLCWSCYVGYSEALTATDGINGDFYLRIKVQGVIGKITINGEPFYEYSTQLASDFTFTACDTNNSNLFNPYANMDCAIDLYQKLSETVSCIVGIPCYYIKLKPEEKSKDMTFKEYTLMNVDTIKQIKIVIQDNDMPSSKPEFAEWGMDWQTDWEVEVTKGSFATAFGVTAQPMEGDLVYIPMMKRMWMVSGAYEEKKDGFMWIASTFKLQLVKYQEKCSVDLGDTEEFVNSIVKNKYEDLFGEDEDSTLDSGTQAVDAPVYAANRLYPVFESDATRKYVTCDSLSILDNKVYYKGTLIAENKYEFMRNDVPSKIIYQKKFCGDQGAISFLINPLITSGYEGTLISIGNIKVNISQTSQNVKLWLNIDENICVNISSNTTFFVTLLWAKALNHVSMTAYRYTYNERIPIYKLQPQHYFFDIDHPVDQYTGVYNDELTLSEKQEVTLYNFYGWITNFKVFDRYNDDVSELLQMYPTHQHLIINDTARKLVDLPGVKPT